MLCPVHEEIENDYEQDVESELAQASAQFKAAVDVSTLPAQTVSMAVGDKTFQVAMAKPTSSTRCSP